MCENNFRDVAGSELDGSHRKNHEMVTVLDNFVPRGHPRWRALDIEKQNQRTMTRMANSWQKKNSSSGRSNDLGATGQLPFKAFSQEVGKMELAVRKQDSSSISGRPFGHADPGRTGTLLTWRHLSACGTTVWDSAFPTVTFQGCRSVGPRDKHNEAGCSP